MTRRPLIGITMRLEIESRRFYLGRDYSEAIAASGGVPLHIGLIPDPEYISRALAVLDGVLLPGSNTDVDPYLYGREPIPQLGTVIPEKDLTDQLVLAEVERTNKPLLAICYGMQALNVFRGGTLIQDVQSQVEGSLKHEQGVPQARPSHRLRIGGESRLSQTHAVKTGKDDIRVNSSHHQAVEKIGRDLKAVAWTSDGIVECIEDTRAERFAIGVQWHPELMTNSDMLSLEIFELFVRECGDSRKGLLAESV